MKDIQQIIENAWENRELLKDESTQSTIRNVIDLLDKGIHVGIHYPVPVHLQPAYKNRVKLARNMRVTENLTNKIVSLPMYPELSIQEATEIVNAVKSFFEEQGC